MNKYGNKQYIAFNRKFDSKKEGLRYIELKTLQMGGEISELECQKSFELLPTRHYENKTVQGVKYIADFYYYDKALKSYVVWEEKGFETDVYKLKKKLFLDRYVATGRIIFIEAKDKINIYKV